MNWNEYFTADYEAGTLTWKTRGREGFAHDRLWKTWNTRYAGKIAGFVTRRGYQMVSLLNKTYLVHRVLFEMANGPIADGIQIDHKDQNKRNNSLSNLRCATSSENKQNIGLRANNSSSVTGVCLHKASGLWVSWINRQGVRFFLGYFADFDLAVKARKDAELNYFGKFAPTH